MLETVYFSALQTLQHLLNNVKKGDARQKQISSDRRGGRQARRSAKNGQLLRQQVGV